MAHAAVEAYLLSDQALIDEWRLGLHYPKIVLQARDEEHLRTIHQYLHDRRILAARVIDEGATEIDPHQRTALGVAIVDRDDPHITATFSTFTLYHDTVRVHLEIER